MRKLIRNFLNQFGYDIVKTKSFNHNKRKTADPKPVKVGNFIIEMPGYNVQIHNYRHDPEMNSQLGRLAACVAAKYAGLTVIDIGANVGDTIAIIKSIIDIPVIGIEGDDISYSFLEKNTAQFKDVTILKKFLGEKKESRPVAFEKSGWNTTILLPEESNQSISLQSLDEVLTEKELMTRNLKLLKIDTEGFDTIILRGAHDMIQQHHPAIYIEFNRNNMEAIKEDGLSTLFSLEAEGYRSVIFFDNNGRYLTTLDINQHEIIRNLYNYTDEEKSGIPYYDLCLFHESDPELAKTFVAGELGRM